LKHGILVVEDNQPKPRAPVRLARTGRLRVRSAADLKASYEAFAERLPDAVYSISISVAKNGLDLVAWMRQKPELWKSP